jgi:hypothetical protein
MRRRRAPLRFGLREGHDPRRRREERAASAPDVVIVNDEVRLRRVDVARAAVAAARRAMRVLEDARLIAGAAPRGRAARDLAAPTSSR